MCEALRSTSDQTQPLRSIRNIRQPIAEPIISIFALRRAQKLAAPTLLAALAAKDRATHRKFPLGTYAARNFGVAVELPFQAMDAPMPPRMSDEDVGRQILGIFMRYHIQAGGTLRRNNFFDVRDADFQRGLNFAIANRWLKQHLRDRYTYQLTETGFATGWKPEPKPADLIASEPLQPETAQPEPVTTAPEPPVAADDVPTAPASAASWRSPA
jgi:hypothetical protein